MAISIMDFRDATYLGKASIFRTYTKENLVWTISLCVTLELINGHIFYSYILLESGTLDATFLKP